MAERGEIPERGLAAQRVVVTGADGFIGSHLAEMLIQAGAEVRALVHYNPHGRWGWLDATTSAHRMDVVLGDIRDGGFCRELIDGADVVFHLAALVGIPYSYRAPESYLDTNARGTHNVCQAALAADCRRVVHMSTSEVYGTARYVPIDESHPLQPQSPYSASKIAADSMAMSYYHAFELPLVVARPFNVFGPRQSARAVIPTIIGQLAQGGARLRLGALTPTRDFTYVEDTCRALMALGSCGSALGQTINIGRGDEIAIGDLATLIAQLMGRTVEIVSEEHRMRPAGSEVHRLVCDNRRLRELTGQAPIVGLREGLQRTIDWFDDPENRAQYRATVYQI